MSFNVRTVHVFLVVEEDECLLRHLCSRCYHVGRASSGATSPVVITQSQNKNKVREEHLACVTVWD